MIYVHSSTPDLNSLYQNVNILQDTDDILLHEMTSNLMARDVKRASTEAKSPKHSAKKKRRTTASEIFESEDTKLDKFGNHEHEVRVYLLRSIRSCTDSEVKVFTTPSNNDNDEEAQHDINEHSNSNYQSLDSYPEVLCELVAMFSKLRRFPKLIGKLLCCIRDCIFKDDAFKLSNVEVFLPTQFMEAIKSIISSLPVGQLMDLFKTLYHNLLEECIKPISKSSGDEPAPHMYFLSVVTDLFNAYLVNIKVADYTVSATTMDKVNEMMSKIRDECLVVLGKAVEKIVKDNYTAYGTHIVNSFLKLSYVWGELHGFLAHYNSDMYKCDVVEWFRRACPDEYESPTNIMFLHSYLTQESLQLLISHIETMDDDECKSSLVMLVVQKLKYMIVLKKTTTKDDESINYADLYHVHLRSTAEYILTHRNLCKLSLPELYNLTSKYLDDSQIIDVVRYIVKHGSVEENNSLIGNSFLNGKFEAILMLETIDYIFTRMSKLKVLPKWCKKIISHQIFCTSGKIAFVSNSKIEHIPVLNSVLHVLNELIEKLVQSDEDDAIGENHDYVNDELIQYKLNLLNKLGLGYYPTHLRTIATLSSAIMLLITASYFETANEKIEIMTSLLLQSGSQSKGNGILFGIAWPKFYLWLFKQSARFSTIVQRKLLMLVLQNIYISTKSVTEFEKESDTIHEDELSWSSTATTFRLITLEFLLKELPVSIQTKSKLTTTIQNHITKLTHRMVKALKKTSSKHHINTTRNDMSLLSNVFRACWLTQLALPTLSSESSETKSMNDDDINRLKRICCKHVESAFKILIPNSNEEENSMELSEPHVEEEIKFAKTFALVFLHSVCKSRKELGELLPETFINQLWTVCMNVSQESWNDLERITSSVDTKMMPKDMFQIATREEFSVLKDSILNEMTTLINMENQESKFQALIHILDCLLDASLSPEVKNDRRQILDGILCSIVQLSLRWNSSNICLKKLILPILQFQIKLLRRRNAICSPISSATCLSSITCVPLNEITEIKLYSDVYCSVAELLNAFTVHRLDVITFRMHIYLQCFQFLIESVTSRANQDNNLTDAELISLKYCAHHVERTCQSMKLNQKEFSRVAPYFVAILMRQFELFAVYPAVKDPLLSGCYKLLDLCDSHGVAQLNSMLTIGSRETFKTVYELYNKFYRYKGKV